MKHLELVLLVALVNTMVPVAQAQITLWDLTILPFYWLYFGIKPVFQFLFPFWFCAPGWTNFPDCNECDMPSFWNPCGNGFCHDGRCDCDTLAGGDSDDGWTKGDPGSFSGRACDTDVDECRKQSSCYYHGECTNSIGVIFVCL